MATILDSPMRPYRIGQCVRSVGNAANNKSAFIADPALDRPIRIDDAGHPQVCPFAIVILGANRLGDVAGVPMASLVTITFEPSRSPTTPLPFSKLRSAGRLEDVTSGSMRPAGRIGIGAAEHLTVPLPHHPACGSAPGGSSS